MEGNDCDLNGTTDATRDCNGNGIDDVVVRLAWADAAGAPADEGTPVGLVLDRSRPGVYRGEARISTRLPTPGTLFVAQRGQGPDGNPRVLATYFDADDSTGQICRNNVDPRLWGLVQHQIQLFLRAADVRVSRFELSDNGDNDGWADDHETVSMRVELVNRSGLDLHDVRLALTTDDPHIACVTRASLDVGDLAAGETRFTEDGFEFVIGEIGRTDPMASRTAQVQITGSGAEFQALLDPKEFSFDLDLDAVGGADPATYFESFDSGFGTFTTMHIDAALNPPDDDLSNNEAALIASDGYRCQYSDPDWGLAVYCWFSGRCSQCYPGDRTPDVFYWRPTEDRAFSGTGSLAWNIDLGPDLGFTEPLSQLEAVGTHDPIHLGFAGLPPELHFAHQIAFVDHRNVNAEPGRSPARAVVSAQLADEAGEPVGDWIKLVPFVNVYDTAANSNYFNCTFDPVDDGNNEEDFFVPEDPTRRFGPSSTCFGGSNTKVFAEQGNTAAPGTRQATAFDPLALNKAEGPGLQGTDPTKGTWVQPRFDLSQFRGRRIRLRFLQTGLKVAGITSWEPLFANNPDPADDGWFLDDVTVTNTLEQPARIEADLKDNSALPACSVACADVTAALASTPDSLAVPGDPVLLNGSGSDADVCAGGVLEYSFWIDVDRDGETDPGADVLLQDWSQDATLRDAPPGTRIYLLAVRCSTDRACGDEASVTIDVACPVGPTGLGPSSPDTEFLLGALPGQRAIRSLPDKQTIAWPSGATADFVRGDLATVRSTGGFTGTAQICLAEDEPDSQWVVDPTLPLPGAAFYYLGRSAEFCNTRAGGSYGAALRDAGLGTGPCSR